MTALCSFLNEEASKSPSPAKFYNVQVFRYEVQHLTVSIYELLCICYTGSISEWG